MHTEGALQRFHTKSVEFGDNILVVFESNTQFEFTQDAEQCPA